MVFNAEQAVLLHQRRDSRVWALPGGRSEPGESPAATAVRETREETGYDIVVQRQLGTYRRPQLGDTVLVYVGAVVGGTPITHGAETLNVGWFPVNALPRTISHAHRVYIEDALMPNDTIVEKEVDVPLVEVLGMRLVNWLRKVKIQALRGCRVLLIQCSRVVYQVGHLLYRPRTTNFFRRLHSWLHRCLGMPFPPPPGTRRLVDRYGRMYYLVEDVYEGGARYMLRTDPPHKHERGRAGYLNLHLKEEGIVEIADLHLEAFARHRGLGTQLLVIARHYAEAHGATQIVGSVTHSDVKETSYLLDWYAHQGFDITRRDAGTRWAADIVCHV